MYTFNSMTDFLSTEELQAMYQACLNDIEPYNEALETAKTKNNTDDIEHWNQKIKDNAVNIARLRIALAGELR